MFRFICMIFFLVLLCYYAIEIGFIRWLKNIFFSIQEEIRCEGIYFLFLPNTSLLFNNPPSMNHLFDKYWYLFYSFLSLSPTQHCYNQFIHLLSGGRQIYYLFFLLLLKIFILLYFSRLNNHFKSFKLIHFSIE